MTSRDYRTVQAMSTSLSNYEQRASCEQRYYRLRAMVIRAKEAGNIELLATLRQQWEELKAEWDAQDVQVAAAALVEEAPDQAAINAANKAAYEIAVGTRPIEVQPGVYLVPSRSRGNVVHRVHAGRCSCEARSSCWHLAAVAIVQCARRASLAA